MKIALIHGQDHKGSTYHIARMTAEKIGGAIEEYFPKDYVARCTGCHACMDQGMEFCPHHDRVDPVLHSMLTADVIVIGSPTYVLGMSGQLKSLFDHLFTAWLSHRPNLSMFTKTAVVVSTAAGMGMNGVTKSLAKQLFYLGVPKIYRIPCKVAATSWDEVKGKNKIRRKTDGIARKVAAKGGKARPGPRLRLMFLLMRQMQKKNDWSPLDKKHWADMGWLAGNRPWKQAR
ncbi:MAG: NAD(P)H-dependent oxidoreductase [Clostridia bacterium]|nr:NAD(P)H-dependent oxidoreductase [Clostridia bacterium]